MTLLSYQVFASPYKIENISGTYYTGLLTNDQDLANFSALKGQNNELWFAPSIEIALIYGKTRDRVFEVQLNNLNLIDMSHVETVRNIMEIAQENAANFSDFEIAFQVGESGSEIRRTSEFNSDLIFVEWLKGFSTSEDLDIDGYYAGQLRAMHPEICVWNKTKIPDIAPRVSEVQVDQNGSPLLRPRTLVQPAVPKKKMRVL